MAARNQEAGFSQRFGPWAVVAGGSDGIGEAFAREIAARGGNVALVARRRPLLEERAAEIRDACGVETRAIVADLTEPGIVEALAGETADLDVGLFVYNAGSNRTPARFLDAPAEDAAFLLHLNCRAPLLLAHHFGGRLRARGRGGVILMSSLAALAGSSYQATYAATKAFDVILAEGLWHEWAPDGVDVLGVLAGATRTPTVLASSARFEDAMNPAEVARGALDHLGRGPTFVPGEGNQAAARGMWPVPRVPLINGLSQAGASLFDLPHRVVDGIEFHEG